jgi:hypothetical protein
MVAVTRNGCRAIASGETPSLSRKNATIKVKTIYESDGVSPLRDDTAPILRHGNHTQKPGGKISNTPSADVSICSERAERRASALARRPRATA